jgi:hypothetical protein
MLSSCQEGDPTGPKGDSPADVTGLILRQNGLDVVEIQQDIVYGLAEIKIGENDVFEVAFIDEQGYELELKESEYSVAFSEVNSDYVDILSVDEGTAWILNLHGQKVGETTFKIQLMNNSRTNPEFESPAIPLTIVQ